MHKKQHLLGERKPARKMQFVQHRKGCPLTGGALPAPQESTARGMSADGVSLGWKVQSKILV